MGQTHERHATDVQSSPVFPAAQPGVSYVEQGQRHARRLTVERSERRKRGGKCRAAGRKPRSALETTGNVNSRTRRSATERVDSDIRFTATACEAGSWGSTATPSGFDLRPDAVFAQLHVRTSHASLIPGTGRATSLSFFGGSWFPRQVVAALRVVRSGPDFAHESALGESGEACAGGAGGASDMPGDFCRRMASAIGQQGAEKLAHRCEGLGSCSEVDGFRVGMAIGRTHAHVGSFLDTFPAQMVRPVLAWMDDDCYDVRITPGKYFNVRDEAWFDLIRYQAGRHSSPVRSMGRSSALLRALRRSCTAARVFWINSSRRTREDRIISKASIRDDLKTA